MDSGIDWAAKRDREGGQPSEPDERLADFPAAAGDFEDFVEPDDAEAESFDAPLLRDDVLDDESSEPPDEEPLDDEESEDVSAADLALLDESDEARASLSADFFDLAPLASARESLR